MAVELKTPAEARPILDVYRKSEVDALVAAAEGDANDALTAATAASAAVAGKADRSVRATAAGRVLAEDSAGQAMIVTDGDGKVDFEPSDDLRRRLGVATMANATIGVFPAGQSNVASINEQFGSAPDIVSRGRVRSRRRHPQIMMPNNGLGVHGTSLVTDGLVSGRNRSIETFGPFTDFVPADERINQRPGEKVAWSWFVPAAETLLDCLGEDLPEVVVCSIGNGSQPLDEADAPERVGLHIDTSDSETVFFTRAVDVITTAIDIAADRGKPMTHAFIPFIWGNAVFEESPGFVPLADAATSAETWAAQIDAYFTALKAAIAAHDDTVNVVFLVVAPHGNSVRGDYPVRLAARLVAEDRTDTWLVGSDYVQTFDGTHYTEDGKALMGALIGQAMHAVLMERMWSIPRLSIARSGQTITLTSAIPLREVPWFPTGNAVKGLYLTSGTITAATMPDAYTITLSCSGVDTGDFLGIGYRPPISGETAVPSPTTLDDLPRYPRAFSPFALLRQTCWSGVLPGQEMPVFLDPQVLEVP